MCDPITATVLAVATTAGSVISQVQAANNQNKVIGQTFDQQTAQITNQESGAINDRLRQARQEQSRIKVAAGESGLQLGGSVNALLSDSLMQEQLAEGRIKTNAANQEQDAINSADSAYSRVSSPTLLGAGLQIASAGVGAYTSASTRALQIKRLSAPSSGG